MLEEDFGSDTDDEDYVPLGEGHEASEEENSGEEEGDAAETAVNRNKKRRKNGKGAQGSKKKVFARGAASDDAVTGWQEDLDREQQLKQEELQKKKAEDIWAEFKTDVKVSSKPAAAKPATSRLADLFGSPAAAKSLAASPLKPKNLLDSLFDTQPPRTLSDSVSSEKDTPAASTVAGKPRSLFSSLFEEPRQTGPSNEAESVHGTSSGETAVVQETVTKVEITKVYDFAGEMVKVTKEVDATSSEAQKFLKTQTPESSGTKRGGLASIVGSIGKKAKMGCLDKSKLDWEQYVAQEGIREELTTFNKGKDGYVEKQMFLERADLRQFEQEKAIREKTRKSLMK